MSLLARSLCDTVLVGLGLMHAASPVCAVHTQGHGQQAHTCISRKALAKLSHLTCMQQSQATQQHHLANATHFLAF